MSFWRVVVGLAVMTVLGVADARPVDVFDHAAVMESLSSVHPRLRGRWLDERGLELPGWNTSLPQTPVDSTGLREVGRWSYGPSFDVDGRVTAAETLVALARGSGVSLLRFARSEAVSLELLCDINAGGLVNRVRVRDSLLFVGSRKGLETWDIADERNPARLSVLGTALNDFALQDTFAFVISDDSFKAYSIADPARPYRVGACLDSGVAIGVTNNAAFLGDRWGLYVVDVSNPAAPHRLTALGYATECVTARGDYCYITTYNPNQSGDIEFRVLNVADPGTPYQTGMVDQAGGYDIELCDTFAYCSGDGNNVNEMTVVSVANPSQPRQVSRANTPGWSMGIWANGRASSAFVGCHWEGLNVYDVRNPAARVRDTWLLGADEAVDIHIDNGRAYVANEKAGLKILDITDPTRPTLLGVYDSSGQSPFLTSAVARDSFAFIEWGRPKFRALDVTNPSRPAFAGTCELFNPSEDMVVRDSLVYIAEASRFQVVNVARPREPRLMGSCVTQDGNYFGLAVQDSLAYLISGSLQIVNIAQPTAPFLLSVTPVFGFGVAVRDTFVYVPYGYDTLRVYSAANPSSLRLLGYAPLGAHAWDVALTGSLAVVGTWNGLVLVDVSDPQSRVNVAAIPTPRSARRVVVDSGLIYTAMYEAGVGVYAIETTGVAEPARGERCVGRAVVVPSPTAGRCVLRLGGQRSERMTVRVVDVSGREVMRRLVADGSGSAELDVGAWIMGTLPVFVSHCSHSI
jgi:hypothetical protein